MKISPVEEAYLTLLEKVLINEVYLDHELAIKYLLEEHLNLVQNKKPRLFAAKADTSTLKKELTQKLHDLENQYSPSALAQFKESRKEGLHIDNDVNLAVFAFSMIGKKRMQNIRHCLEIIFEQNILGDVIECGVWKGGAAMYMQGLLKTYGQTHRQLWVADSFAGLPVSSHAKDQAFFADASANSYPNLAVSEEKVEANFAKLDLLEANVKFVKGWFSESLLKAPIEKLALLRLDGDLYESTLDALNALYPKLSAGGFVIIDDYALDPCREAVEEYRKTHQIKDAIHPIDSLGAFWRKA